MGLTAENFCCISIAEDMVFIIELLYDSFQLKSSFTCGDWNYLKEQRFSKYDTKIHLLDTISSNLILVLSYIFIYY